MTTLETIRHQLAMHRAVAEHKRDEMAQIDKNDARLRESVNLAPRSESFGGGYWSGKAAAFTSALAILDSAENAEEENG